MPDSGLQPPLVLSLGRIAVRRHEADDAPALARHANDHRVAANLRDAFPHPYALANAEQYIAMVRLRTPVTNGLVVVDGEPCGGIGYILHEDVERVGAEVGYWLGAAYWGQGVMTTVLPAFARLVFARHGELRRLWAAPFAGNAASARVLEKSGFRLEGTMRQSAIKLGMVHDQRLYALLRDEAPGS